MQGALTVTRDALRALIKNYCPDVGVRNLKRHIQRIFARALLKARLLPFWRDRHDPLQRKGADAIVVKESDLPELINEPPPSSLRYYSLPFPAGVAIGLGGGAGGGTIMYVECVKLPKYRDH